MLLPGEIELVKLDIKRLEKGREEFTDSGLRRVIEAWIEALKKKLDEKM